MDYRVTSAEALSESRLRVRWNDGLDAVVDFSDLIRTDGLYRELSDPTRFADVRLYEYGHGIYWLGSDGSEIDICPDVLRAKADPKMATWIAEQEAAWHVRQAAE